MRYIIYALGLMILWAGLSYSQKAVSDSLITEASVVSDSSSIKVQAGPDSAQVRKSPAKPDSAGEKILPAASETVQPQLADSVRHIISSEIKDDYGYNAFKNARFIASAGFLYSPSANIRDDYIFPGYQFDAGLLWSTPWASDSLGLGFKVGLTHLSFEDNYTVPSLKFVDLQLLFLVTWGNLYRCPIMFQPHLGYSVVWGKSVGKKLCFTYGGRLFMKLPSFGDFRILVDGQMVNTDFTNRPFSGTLAMIYFGVGYIH